MKTQRSSTARLSRTVFVILTSLLPYFFTSGVHAQTRPLRTPDAEILPPGTSRTQVGFDFLQDIDYPLSGLSGDQTSIATYQLRTAVGRIVEIQMEGAIRHFLSVKQQTAGVITPQLTSADSTHDFGDITFYTKVRLLGEGPRRPALAFRFGYTMPTSNQARGIGTNTTNLFSDIILQKHIGKFNLFGSVGLAILEAPTANFAQNDVFTYGVAAIYSAHQRVNLLAEVSGRYSSRPISPGLVGTESRSQARFGVQINAGGLHWDFAGIAGLTSVDAKTGFTFGVRKDLKLFDYPPR